jgi:hypothetical protein
MRKREVIEPRKVSIKLKPIPSYWKQATFSGSIIARSEEFNRGPRTWRVLQSAITEQERSCVLHVNKMYIQIILDLSKNKCMPFHANGKNTTMPPQKFGINEFLIPFPTLKYPN